MKLPPSFTVEGMRVLEDFLWWAERLKRHLSEGREDCAYANNHYQKHSPSTLQQFLAILRENR